MAATATTEQGPPGDQTAPLTEEQAPPGPTFSEVWFDDPVEGEAAQRAALELKHRIEIRAKPIRMYLEETVVPLLLQGLQHLVLERPSNPIQYLAAFLLKNDPYPPPDPIEVNFDGESGEDQVLEDQQTTPNVQNKSDPQSKSKVDEQSKPEQNSKSKPPKA
ncbi:hypothetical protein KP509_02G075300 [Ceratopteris richardii]|uniref:Uncharacterized protein n=1 Tax=Ceratopteris richardii TaxID=49495 RepID=A0A8T2VF36_CERRI|nr:hypothetical protein KP509_02G075300 [Ceratopteris richardii]KAH7444362.1 hypothetical protein KP509_02G075300 [Ceratopteris richardii]KAH7444363.1 hypothetical protein KP509_02G075300 [Ceratopteris richardii]